VANSYSDGDWRLEKASAMLLPSVGIKRSTGRTRLTRLLLWGVPAERLVNATAIVIGTERLQLSLQIERIPEEHAIAVHQDVRLAT
jgi:hypothetical protein